MAASPRHMSRMFWPVVGAELRAGFKRPLLYVCAAVFFFLAFQTISITSPTASGVIRIGRLWHNSPYIVAKLIAVLSVMATFVSALLIAPAVQRDFQQRTHALFLSVPITRLDYLLGRFLGAYIATLLVFLAAIAGIVTAALSIPPEFSGPFRLAAFIEPLLLFALPNLLLTGAISFAVGTLSRSMMAAYIAAVVTMVVLGVGQSILDEVLQKDLVSGPARYVLALGEPFGGAALQIMTAAWSPAEKNTRTIPLFGVSSRSSRGLDGDRVWPARVHLAQVPGKRGSRTPAPLASTLAAISHGFGRLFLILDAPRAPQRDAGIHAVAAAPPICRAHDA